MLAVVCATLSILLAAAAPPDRTVKRGAAVKQEIRRPQGAPTRANAKRPAARPAKGSSDLERARALLAEVKRDPAKRRYRHHWEKAITALERSAHGRDTGTALLEAARARYALYRFSQVDSDRTKALALASKAEGKGAREASALRLAIRAEMGEPAERQPSRSVTTRPASVATRTGSGPATRPRPATSGPAAQASTPSTATSPDRGRGERPGTEVARAATPRAAPHSSGTVTGTVVKTPAPSTAQLSATAPAAREDRAAAAVPPPAARSAVAPPSTEEDSSIDAILERALANEASATGDEAARSASVGEIKSWSNHDYTRIAIYLSRNVSFERVDLPAEASGPRRVALDLRPAKVGQGVARMVGDALVQRVRATQADPDTVRVTLELSGREELTIFPLEDPTRLIVDVGAAPVTAPAIANRAPPRRSTDPARPGASAAPPPGEPGAPPSTPAPSDELAVRGPIRRVIVDAGHGGHDTGAIGPTNVREKDVTLAMAKRLARRLRARGYEVVLTRDDDRYLALEERTAIANARHGDLFVSLHANAHPRREQRGVETYVLNVADDRYAARLAARENGAFGESAAGSAILRRILSDLDAQVSAESSRRIATAVQRELCSGIRARYGEARDLGVKSALFYVLLGARMPAVLVETAFISNRAEEKRLASPAFQDEVAAAIVRAVERAGASDARIAAAR